jgi:hypothetical protein
LDIFVFVHVRQEVTLKNVSTTEELAGVRSAGWAVRLETPRGAGSAETFLLRKVNLFVPLRPLLGWMRLNPSRECNWLCPQSSCVESMVPNAAVFRGDWVMCALIC